MNHVFKLSRFLKPYKAKSVLSLVLLVFVVVLDLLIPRLVQRIIDFGVLKSDISLIVHTFLLMVCVSVLNTLFALGNNSFSIQVGEGVARDLRNALFKKIQSFSHGNLDRLKTGELMVLLSSDTGVVQRLFQISLRIGTRAPLLMAGSLALMFSTDPSLALVLLPLLVLVSGIIAFFSAVLSPLFTKLQNVLDGPTKESEIM